MGADIFKNFRWMGLRYISLIKFSCNTTFSF